MEERKISEKESLSIITAMIERTKERYIGDGNIMIMWGCLVAAVSLAVWILLATTNNGVWNWLWFLIPIVGGIATPIMARRQQSYIGARTYSDTIMSRLWTIVGLSSIAAILVCLGFQIFGGVDAWMAMLAYTLVCVPVAEVMQGLVIKENSLVCGGCFGLATGIITVCCMAGGVPLKAYWFMPLFIASFVAMMIIPGLILNAKSKRK